MTPPTPPQSESDAAPDFLERSQAFLRGNSTATFHFDERIEQIRYVIAGDGSVFAPVPAVASEADQTILFIPNEQQDAMEVMVTLDEPEVDSPDADRWMIYHGKPLPGMLPTRMYIEAAKYRLYVVDGEKLQHTNPLVSIEPRLCKEVNRSHLGGLKELCRIMSNVDVDDPRLVGVDPWGLDVRAPFGIVRLPLHDVDNENPDTVFEHVMHLIRATEAGGVA